MAENASVLTPPLLQALSDIAAWREQAEEIATRQRGEVDAEEAEITAAIADLERRLSATRARRTQIDESILRLEPEETRRSHRAVLDSIVADRKQLESRGVVLTQAWRASAARAEAMLQDPALGEALAEYEQFAQIEPTLKTLPAGYRNAVLAHHDDIRKQLAPLFRELAGDNLSVKLDPTNLSVVASIDPAQGRPQTLVLIAPVAASYYEAWDSHEQDLMASVAYRMWAAAARIASLLGAADAPIKYVPFHGHIAIWVRLADHDLKGALREVTSSVLADLPSRSRELRLANLRFSAIWLPPSVLQLPDELADDAGATEAAPEEAPEAPAPELPALPEVDAPSVELPLAPAAESAAQSTTEDTPIGTVEEAVPDTMDEEVGDDITEDEEPPGAVLADENEEDIPDFYIAEPEA